MLRLMLTWAVVIVVVVQLFTSELSLELLLHELGCLVLKPLSSLSGAAETAAVDIFWTTLAKRKRD